MKKLLLLTIASLMSTCSVMAQLQFGNGWQTGSENVTYTDADVINIHIAGTNQNQYDRLHLSSGTLTAGNASLNLIVCQPPVTGDKFIIFKAPTIDGEFSNPPFIDVGGNFLILSYEKGNGDDIVVLTAVAKLFGLGISTLGAEPLTPDYSYTLNVLAEPTEGGTVSPTQATFSVCDAIDIEATANEGYHFSHWTQEGGAIIDDTEASATTATMPTRDVTITANFCKFPEAPTATAATGVSTNTFTANWEAVTGTLTYTLDVALDDDFTNFVSDYENYEIVGTLSQTVSVFCTATYFYRVKATDECGSSDYSGTVSVTATATLTDSRDGNVYNTVLIGNQCWLKENMKYLPAVAGLGTGSNTDPYYYVYGYNGTDVGAAKVTANYLDYGALYNWPAALNACPTSWHLPSDAEWTQLTNYVGDNAGTKLKATSGWGSEYNGSDDYGFSGLPGGGYLNLEFDGLIDRGAWWSATVWSTGQAWNRFMQSDYEQVTRVNFSKSYGFSVRCLRD